MLRHGANLSDRVRLRKWDASCLTSSSPYISDMSSEILVLLGYFIIVIIVLMLR